MSGQVVDPAVSRAKFDREVADFERRRPMHRRRGWWVLNIDFPIVEVAFATPNLRPASVAFAVRIDFTNYDLWAPSVLFIDPFSGEVLTRLDQVQAPMFRATPTGQQRLVQWHPDAGQPPFICLPGVREYHSNPGHSGDDWLLHRGRGEGGLFFLVDKLSHYGSETITTLQVEMTAKLAQGIFVP